VTREYYNGFVRLRVVGASCRLVARLGDGPFREYLAVDQWWHEVVWILRPEIKVTRRDIILAATNKDGGAHVDEKLSIQYEDLAAPGAGGFFAYRDRPDIAPQPLMDAHLISLRQMGYEVISSDGLRSLLRA
jgi:hypothetical protein